MNLKLEYLNPFLWRCGDCFSFPFNSQGSLKSINILFSVKFYLYSNIRTFHLLVNDGLFAKRCVGEDHRWNPYVTACFLRHLPLNCESKNIISDRKLL